MAKLTKKQKQKIEMALSAISVMSKKSTKKSNKVRMIFALVIPIVLSITLAATITNGI